MDGRGSEVTKLSLTQNVTASVEVMLNNGNGNDSLKPSMYASAVGWYFGGGDAMPGSTIWCKSSCTMLVVAFEMYTRRIHQYREHIGIG